MLHAHETSCKTCADATFMKLDAVIDMAERLIPLSEEADQVSTALYRSRLDQITGDVISTHAAQMLLEGQTLGRLLQCPEVMPRTSESEMSEGTTVNGDSRSSSPDPTKRTQNPKRLSGKANAKSNFDPRARTSASASRGLQSIQNLVPTKS